MTELLAFYYSCDFTLAGNKAHRNRTDKKRLEPWVPSIARDVTTVHFCKLQELSNVFYREDLIVFQDTVVVLHVWPRVKVEYANNCLRQLFNVLASHINC